MRRLLALVFLVYLLGLGRVTLGPASTPSRAVETTATQVDRSTQADGESPQNDPDAAGGLTSRHQLEHRRLLARRANGPVPSLSPSRRPLTDSADESTCSPP